MFRVLRLHNPELEKVYGFCFPKWGTNSVVTKVEVSFDVETFAFKAKCRELLVSNVQAEVLSVFGAAYKYLPPTCEKLPRRYYLRLGPKEMEEMKKMLNTDDLQQEPTAHSFLFRSGTTYHKIILHNSVADVIPVSKSDHVLQYTSKCIRDTFLVYSSQALIQPLAPAEIAVCLSDFMALVAAALRSLHHLKFAHLDVRVPNVCFKRKENDVIAVLIDLDRASVISNCHTPPYEGDMYKMGGLKWTHGQLDWKQLGILGSEIAKESDEFLLHLQNQGNSNG
jgi:virulence-associated protein VapD